MTILIQNAMKSSRKKSSKDKFGAEKTVFDGIEFKSKLERFCYQKLKDANLDFGYETESVTLLPSLKLSNVKVFCPKKRTGGIVIVSELSQRKVVPKMSYTPDFLVKKGKYRIYIETKGKPNDAYPYRKKLFIHQLEHRKDKYEYIFMEPHNNRQVMWAIDFITKL